MKIIRSIAVSFSLYSRIPMPSFKWEEEDMKHAISFLPFIGAFIGALIYFSTLAYSVVTIPGIAYVFVLAVIPLIVTGGFHMDGFMDVQDAKNSYQPKERKLEIMKDPHIGAFAVISFAVCGLLWISALLIIYDNRFANLVIYGISFAFVRAACGLTSLKFPKAKKEGMLTMETGNSNNLDVAILTAFLVISGGMILYLDLIAGVSIALVLLLFTVYYHHMCIKNFGGVTGDTAGFYVVAGELVMALTLAIVSLLTFPIYN